MLEGECWNLFPIPHLGNYVIIFTSQWLVTLASSVSTEKLQAQLQLLYTVFNMLALS